MWRRASWATSDRWKLSRTWPVLNAIHQLMDCSGYDPVAFYVRVDCWMGYDPGGYRRYWEAYEEPEWGEMGIGPLRPVRILPKGVIP